MLWSLELYNIYLCTYIWQPRCKEFIPTFLLITQNNKKCMYDATFSMNEMRTFLSKPCACTVVTKNSLCLYNARNFVGFPSAFIHTFHTQLNILYFLLPTTLIFVAPYRNCMYECHSVEILLPTNKDRIIFNYWQILFVGDM